MRSIHESVHTSVDIACPFLAKYIVVFGKIPLYMYIVKYDILGSLSQGLEL